MCGDPNTRATPWENFHEIAPPCTPSPGCPIRRRFIKSHLLDTGTKCGAASNATSPEKNIKVRIFVSYASEDLDFVNRLVEVLKCHYEVWFAPYELTIGDSLLRKIGKGLTSCDFGVVVLSNAFFAKKWPQAELDGLFALEEETRKMILPVWRSISEHEVKRFSPILAGRLATIASQGIEKVISDLRKAIDVSSRTREINVLDSPYQTCKALDETLQARENADRLSRCEEGAALVRVGFETLHAAIQRSIAEISAMLPRLNLVLSRPARHAYAPFVFHIDTGHKLNMSVALLDLGDNYTYEARIACTLYRPPDLVGQQPAEKLRELTFRPTFKLPNELVWIGTPDKPVFTTVDLAAHILMVLMSKLKEEAQRN